MIKKICAVLILCAAPAFSAIGSGPGGRFVTNSSTNTTEEFSVTIGTFTNRAVAQQLRLLGSNATSYVVLRSTPISFSTWTITVPGSPPVSIQCVRMAPNGDIDFSACSGGGGTALGVNQNGVTVTSPTFAINGLSPPFLITAVGSGATAQWTLDPSSVTLQGQSIIRLTSTLQTGSTFYVSSATIRGLNLQTTAGTVFPVQRVPFMDNTIAGLMQYGNLYFHSSANQLAIGTTPSGTDDLLVGNGATINGELNLPALTASRFVLTNSTKTLTTYDLFNASPTYAGQASWTSTSPSTFTSLTVSGLTSGQCVQTTTGGRLTVSGAACGTGSGGGSGIVAPGTFTWVNPYGIEGSTVVVSSGGYFAVKNYTPTCDYPTDLCYGVTGNCCGEICTDPLDCCFGFSPCCGLTCVDPPPTPSTATVNVLYYQGWKSTTTALTSDTFWHFPPADASGFWRSNGTFATSISALALADMPSGVGLTGGTNQWTGTQSWYTDPIYDFGTNPSYTNRSLLFRGNYTFGSPQTFVAGRLRYEHKGTNGGSGAPYGDMVMSASAINGPVLYDIFRITASTGQSPNAPHHVSIGTSTLQNATSVHVQLDFVTAGASQNILYDSRTLRISTSAVIPELTVSGLTSGQCVQTTTGGRLTVTGSACGSGGAGDAVLAATQTWTGQQTWSSPAPSTITYLTVGDGSSIGSLKVRSTASHADATMILQATGGNGDGNLDYYSDFGSLYERLRMTNTNLNTGTVENRYRSGWNFEGSTGKVGVYITRPSATLGSRLVINSTGTLELFDGDSSAAVIIRASDTVTTSYTVQLPSAPAVSTGAFVGVQAISGNSADLNYIVPDLGSSAFSGTLAAGRFPALTGDVTTSAGSLATTLASVVTANQYGSTTVVPVITFDAKGRLTAVSSATIAAPTVMYSTVTLQFRCPALDKLETNFAVNTSTNTGTSKYMTCSFDNSTQQYVNGFFMVPNNLDTGGTITIRTQGRSSTAASSKNVGWILEHQALSNGDSYGTAFKTSTSGALAVSATQGVNDILTWTMSVSSAAWTASQSVNFRFSRDVGVTNNLASPYYNNEITVAIPVTVSPSR